MPRVADLWGIDTNDCHMGICKVLVEVCPDICDRPQSGC